MATVIKIKNSSQTAEPADNVLAKGELAYSYSSNKLFIGQTINSVVEAIDIGGKAYSDLIDTSSKEFTAASITNAGNVAITTTSNGNITLTPGGTGITKIDNLDINTNTISASNANGDIILTPNGTGLLKTDNLGFGGNTISSTDTNGDIILTPNGNGKVKTDNLSFDGSTIASFTANGTENTNITLNPQASGTVDVSSAKITSLGTPTANTDAATKAYVDTEVGNVSSDITISDNQGTPVTDTLTTGSTFTIAGTANEIETAVTDEGGSQTGNATVTIGLPNDVTIGQDLTVTRDTTVTGDLGVNGGDLTTSVTTFNLLDTTATTINFGGAATTVDIGAASGTTTINNNAVVSGNLTVNGTTTTVNSNTVTIDDPIFTLGGDSLADQVANYSTDTKDRGIEFKYSDGTATVTAGSLVENVVYVIINAGSTDFTASPYNAGSNDAGTEVTGPATDNGTGDGVVVAKSALKTGFFGYDDTDDKFKFLTSATNTSEEFSGTAGDVEFGAIQGSNLTLTGNIASVDGAAPTDGQLLIGNGTNNDFQKGSIAVTTNTGLSVTPGAGTITLAGSDSSTQATVDPVAELVQAGSFETGVEYTIVSTGNTNFTAIGADADPAVGETFTATGAGSGDGTAISSGDNFAVSGTNTSKGVASFASEQFTVTSGHVVVTTIDGGEF